MLKRLGLLIVALLVVALAAAVLLYQDFQRSLSTELSLTAPQEFEVVRGDSARSVIAEMRDKGWFEAQYLSNRWHTSLLLRLYPQLAGVKTGLYELTPQMTLIDALNLMVDGKQKKFYITLVEGGTIKQWMAQLHQQHYLQQQLTSIEDLVDALAIEQANPEGWFYPSTYQYHKGHSDLDILKRAYQQMQRHLDTAWQQRQAQLPLKSPYELLILASIIEKETAVADERDWVSAVFINRLNKGMRLQTDPTVIYGLGERYKGNITRAHLREKTPYNTYRINGLPPTPIASAGLASLKAAANPADVPYLYFVATGKGGHKFSTNLADHNKAVKEYLRTIR
ncbi:endolytic transglycosylase MltG [Paraferrimonas haliotis]|uniref:endolytic transglycosylase MltG n=1 Tax=Paraferrimonas haliotis TaxID=2013866 RepID=UPI000BA96EA9|nr:endolytic transglycosylase MltG [Paraferrimonas haliotis]